MDKQIKETLMKTTELIKQAAKEYYLKKYASARAIEHYLALKELEKDSKNGLI